MLADVAAAGVDHVFMADHVSFRNGSGTDGFVEIAGLSQLHPSMGVMISIYLLPLRHPVPVARQLATAHWFDTRAAARDFGYTPTISIAEGLKRLQESHS